MSSEPIQVYIRFRPLNFQEITEGELPIWYMSKNTISLLREHSSQLIAEKRISSTFNPNYHYSHVFTGEDDNRKVYETVAQKVVLSALEGFNATIFAYGQTGSGKTFTMIGQHLQTAESPTLCTTPPLKQRPRASRAGTPSSARIRSCSSTPRGKSMAALQIPLRLDKPRKVQTDGKGIISMALNDIFKAANDYKDKHFFFTCSMMEIYNEHVYDLLKETEDLKNEVLAVSEGSDKEFYVRGLSEKVVTSIEEVLEKLGKGEENRHYAATNLNHHSSRSHTIFRLNIRSLQVIPKKDSETLEGDESFENITTESVINFVDLAGSERTSSVMAIEDKHNFSYSSTRSEQDRIVAESKNINTSLFYLCQVITKLSELKMGLIKNESHIPYRNSNLTKILRSSLGGNSRTCVICAVTPALSQFEQTLSTLRFGNSARSITNNVKANVKRETNAQLLVGYQQDIATLKKELEMAKEQGWASYVERNQAKQALEQKIQKLNEILAVPYKPETFQIEQEIYSNFSTFWNGGVGDLFIANQPFDQEDSKVLSESKLNFDNSGKFAQERRMQIDREQINIEKEIEKLTVVVNSLKGNKNTLVTDLEKNSNLYEKSNKENAFLREDLAKSRQTLSKMKYMAKIYQQGEGLDSLSESQLTAFEKTLIERLDSVKQIKASRLYDHKIEKLQESLLKFLPESMVLEMFSENESREMTEKFESFMHDISSQHEFSWNQDILNTP
ncbi:unnamed protein product [Blepharisma stoltei]|uniref:Kinesin-like protein n=1 Tax=Blepharisma stoltei TaxID=1481888 RepID=A0AAU9IT79_9CILI|nr:unnamed protein product [Blepharisma stoltei]